MLRTRTRPGLVVIGCLFVGLVSARYQIATARPTDPDDVLSSKGIEKVKGGKYALKYEQEAFRSFQQFLKDAATADDAVYAAGEVATRNQAVILFRNRIAGDMGQVEEARVDKLDGKTLEEQYRYRQGRKDAAIARQQRARQGLAGAKLTPKLEKQLASEAEKATSAANASWDTLVRSVHDVIGRYQKVSADPAVQKAIGAGKLEPTERFQTLAERVGISKKQLKTAIHTVRSPGATPKQLTEAIAEMEKAKSALEDVKFNKGFKGYAPRNERKADTLKAIDAALAKMKAGDSNVKVLEEARELHDGYTGSSAPEVRAGLAAVSKHLNSAAKLLRELDDPAG